VISLKTKLCFAIIISCLLCFSACGEIDEAEMTDTESVTDITSESSEPPTEISEQTSESTEEITTEYNPENFQKLSDIAEDTLFLGNNIQYSDPYYEQSDMAKRCFDIINSGVYEEYFIESDTVHDFCAFNDYISYCEFYDNGDAVCFIGKDGEYYEYYNYSDESYKTDNCRSSFLGEIMNNYTYTESCYFTAYDEKHICEKYVSGDNICMLYFREGDICGAVQLLDNEIHVIENYRLYESSEALNKESMSEAFNRCQNHHTQEQEHKHENHHNNNANNFQYSFNFNQNNNFDFEAERIRGENIENPHIVDRYREYFDTAENFTIYITAKRGDLMQYEYATKSGNNYLNKGGLQKSGERAIINENLEVDNRHYSRCYYEDETIDYTLYDDADDTGIYIYYIIQNNDRPEFNDVDEFIEAYNVTINNEDYICEVWHAGVTDFNIYCKDRKVITIDTIFYDEHEYSVIEYMYDYAESENLTAPENYNTHSEEENYNE